MHLVTCGDQGSRKIRSELWTGTESKGTGNNSRVEPRRNGVGSLRTTSTSSMGGKTNSRARSRNVMELPRTRPKRMSTLGSSHCRNDEDVRKGILSSQSV